MLVFSLDNSWFAVPSTASLKDLVIKLQHRLCRKHNSQQSLILLCTYPLPQICVYQVITAQWMSYLIRLFHHVANSSFLRGRACDICDCPHKLHLSIKLGSSLRLPGSRTFKSGRCSYSAGMYAVGSPFFCLGGGQLCHSAL